MFYILSLNALHFYNTIALILCALLFVCGVNNIGTHASSSLTKAYRSIKELLRTITPQHKESPRTVTLTILY